MMWLQVLKEELREVERSRQRRSTESDQQARSWLGVDVGILMSSTVACIQPPPVALLLNASLVSLLMSGHEAQVIEFLKASIPSLCCACPGIFMQSQVWDFRLKHP